MASNDIAICNSALAKLGAARIKSLDQDSNEADLCKLRYFDCRDMVLQSHSWKCAIKRQILSPVLPAPAFGYTNFFQLPSDYLKQIPDDEGKMLGVENGKIISNQGQVNLRYIARIEDATLFPPYLAEVIAHRLACDLCYGITQSAPKQELQEKLYEAALRRARFADSAESKAPNVSNSYLLDTRLRGATISAQT